MQHAIPHRRPRFATPQLGSIIFDQDLPRDYKFINEFADRDDNVRVPAVSNIDAEIRSLIPLTPEWTRWPDYDRVRPHKTGPPQRPPPQPLAAAGAAAAAPMHAPPSSRHPGSRCPGCQAARRCLAPSSSARPRWTLPLHPPPPPPPGPPRSGS